MTSRHGITHVYVSCGESPMTPALERQRDEIHALLRANGMEPVEGASGRMKHEALHHIDAALDQADAYIFFGRPKDPVSLFAAYYMIDKAQSRLKGAMLRNPDLSLRHTPDGKVIQKPIIVMNGEGENDVLIDRLNDLVTHGGAKQTLIPDAEHRGIIDPVKSTHEAARVLMEGGFRTADLFKPPQQEHKKIEGKLPSESKNPKVFVCCGFSIREPYFLDTAEKGAGLSAETHDTITGGGRAAMMMRYQKGVFDALGHVWGITFDEINPLAHEHGKGSDTFGISYIQYAENMPERITEMVTKANGMLILPGGVGTDTECIAPLLMRELGYKVGPLLIQNLTNPRNGERCHDSLITLLGQTGFKEGRDFLVARPNLKDAQGHDAEVTPGRKVEGWDMEKSVEAAAEMTAEMLRRHIKMDRRKSKAEVSAARY